MKTNLKNENKVKHLYFSDTCNNDKYKQTIGYFNDGAKIKETIDAILEHYNLKRLDAQEIVKALFWVGYFTLNTDFIVRMDTIYLNKAFTIKY